jgi:GST-like protein
MEEFVIELFAANTPNNLKVFAILEELGMPYEVRPLKLAENEQKEPWFLKINPNGRTPAIVDQANEGFAVFESGAILIYLAEKAGRLLPTEGKSRSLVLQWLMFQMSGVGPMQGQVNVFRQAKEQIPFAIERYANETRRLYKVLDARLGEAEFLAGEYSIADIATWPWVRLYKMSQVSIEGMSNLKRWLEAMDAREACKVALRKAGELRAEGPRPWLDALRTA